MGIPMSIIAMQYPMMSLALRPQIPNLMSIQIVLQPIHTFGNIFHGGGIGKSEVAFSVPAEIDAGRYSHMSLFKDVEREFV